MMFDGFGYGNGWGVIATAIGGWFLLCVWAVSVTVTIWVLGNHSKPAAHVPGPIRRDAEAILNERFAAGAIDEDELLARRAVLRRGA